MSERRHKNSWVGYIYAIYINNPSSSLHGSFYIGKRQKPKIDKYYFGSSKKLAPYYKKYGYGYGAEVEIIFWSDDIEELNSLEIGCIDTFRSNPKCLNIADGGNGGNLVTIRSQLWDIRRANGTTKAWNKGKKLHYDVWNKGNRSTVELLCQRPGCDKTFLRDPCVQKHGRGKYCSTDCQYLSKKVGQYVGCDNCGKDKYVTNWHIKNKKSHFCSRTCLADFRRGLSMTEWRGVCQ